MHRASTFILSFIVGVGLWLPAVAASAADLKSCAIVDTSVVQGVLGQKTDVYSLPGAPAGMDACAIVDANDDDYTIVRQNGRFSADSPSSAGAVAKTFFPQLSDDTLAQINAAAQPGTGISAPGFDITVLSGPGDAAVQVRTVPATMVSILIGRGADVFMFQTDDLGAQPGRQSTLVQAVVANAGPSVSVAGVTVPAPGGAAGDTMSSPAGGAASGRVEAR